LFEIPRSARNDGRREEREKAAAATQRQWQLSGRSVAATFSSRNARHPEQSGAKWGNSFYFGAPIVIPSAARNLKQFPTLFPIPVALAIGAIPRKRKIELQVSGMRLKI